MLEWALIALFVLILATLPFASRARSDALDHCDFEMGGSVETCATMARRHPHAGEEKMAFHSAGILALERARCVDPGSTWSFHGSYLVHLKANAQGGYDETKEPSSYGSGVMRNSLAKYPLLVKYLDARGVWANNGEDFVTLTGAELGRLGVPNCGR
jgi:hypothetical protein